MKILATFPDWGEKQHYGNRPTPPWIKFHRDLLNSKQYFDMPIEGRAILPLLWLIGSESKDGVIDLSIDNLSWRLRLSKSEIDKGVSACKANGFVVLIDSASNVLATCLHDASPEKSREEKSTHIDIDTKFDVFWPQYPKKESKVQAKKAWNKAKINGEFPEVMAALNKQKEIYIANKKNVNSGVVDWQYFPMASTWINNRRWEDEIEVPRIKNQFEGML